jgi:plasmid stability protein
MGMIQIRNVPPELHRKLKVRAAQNGMSLSDYLLAEIEQTASLPTPEEFKERLHSLPPLELDIAPHEIIRAMRDAAG